MRVRASIKGEKHVVDGTIDCVTGSGDEIEIKIEFPGGAVWLEFDKSDRPMIDAIIGRATAVGQGRGHPAFDKDNLAAVSAFRKQRR